MTIRELIIALQKYENQEADVTIEVAENSENLRDVEWELFSDTSVDGYITIGVEL